MEFLTGLFIIFILAAILGPKKGKRKRRSASASRSRSSGKPAQRISSREPKPDPYTYLYQHWKEVAEGRYAVPRWYNDQVTEAQLQRLRDDDIKLPGRPITKGQASDLIGLGESAEPGQIEILKFFKVSGLPLQHQSIAAIEIDRLLSNPDNADKWINRPATAIQKEYYRFFGITVPKGLTASEAEATIAEHELSDEEDDAWYSYCSLIEDLQDKDFRKDYGLKKPSIPLIRQAIDQHISQGSKVTELLPDDLIDTLIAIKPDIQKS